MPAKTGTPVTLAAFLAVFYVALGTFVHNTPVNDFEKYWSYGRALAIGEIPELFLPIYAIRALPYTFVVHQLFGDSLPALRMVNVGLVLGAAMLYYKLLRNFADLRVACLATLLFSLWPDILLATPMPSHDIPTLFWFACFLLIYGRLSLELKSERWFHAFAYSLLLGSAIFLLDIQRNYGPMLLVALPVLSGLRFILSVDRGKQFWSRALLGVLIPILATFGLKSFLMERHPTLFPDDGAKVLAAVAAVDFSPVATGVELNLWMWHMFPAIPEAERNAYSLRKIASEFFSSPLEASHSLLRRNRRLAQVNQYSFRYPLERHRQFFSLFNYGMSWFVGLMALLAVVGLYSFSREGLPVELQLILTTAATLYSAIWLVGEVSGHYDIFLAFALPVLASKALLNEQLKWEGVPYSGAIAVTIALLMVSVLLVSQTAHRRGVLFVTFPSDIDVSSLENRGIDVQPSGRSLRFLAKPEETGLGLASVRLPVRRKTENDLSFIITPRLDGKALEDRRAGSFELTVKIDERSLYQNTFELTAEPLFVKIPWPKGASAVDLVVSVATEDLESLRIQQMPKKSGFLSLDLLSL